MPRWPSRWVSPVMAGEGPGPGFSGSSRARRVGHHGASGGAEVRRATSSCVGSPDVIHALSTKHGLHVKRSLKSGAVVELTAASLAALAGDPGYPRSRPTVPSGRRCR